MLFHNYFDWYNKPPYSELKDIDLHCYGTFISGTDIELSNTDLHCYGISISGTDAEQSIH